MRWVQSACARRYKTPTIGRDVSSTFFSPLKSGSVFIETIHRKSVDWWRFLVVTGAQPPQKKTATLKFLKFRKFEIFEVWKFSKFRKFESFEVWNFSKFRNFESFEVWKVFKFRNFEMSKFQNFVIYDFCVPFGRGTGDQSIRDP